MFAWFFDPLPDPLQWVALFIGAIALFLALVGLLMWLLEALVAAPNVILDFTVEDKTGGRYLVCHVFNLPFQNRVVRRLLQRRAAIATAQFAIRDVRTNQYVVGVPVAAMRVEAHTPADRVTLLASALPYALPIIAAGDDGHNAVFPGRFGVDPTAELNPGRYEATVQIVYDGGEVSGLRQFEVGTKGYEAFWANK